MLSEKVREDNLMEELIRAELDALNESDLDTEDELEEDENLVKEEFDVFKMSMSKYISLIQTHNVEAEERVEETKNIMAAMENIDFKTDELLKKKLCEELDEIYEDRVLAVRDEVLHEIEKEETRQITGSDVNSAAIEELEENGEVILEELNKAQQLAENGERLLAKQKRKEGEEYDEVMRKRQEEKSREIEDLQLKLQDVDFSINNQNTCTDEDEQIKIFQRDMKEEIDIISKDINIEKERLISFQNEMTEKNKDRMIRAAIIIQKNFRRYRVLKLYEDDLKEMKLRIKLKQKAKLKEMMEKQRKILADKENKKREQLQKLEDERLEKERKEKEKEERKRAYEEQKTIAARERALQKQAATKEVCERHFTSISVHSTIENEVLSKCQFSNKGDETSCNEKLAPNDADTSKILDPYVFLDLACINNKEDIFEKEEGSILKQTNGAKISIQSKLEENTSKCAIAEKKIDNSVCGYMVVDESLEDNGEQNKLTTKIENDYNKLIELGENDYDKTVEFGEDSCNKIIELGENDYDKTVEFGEDNCNKIIELRENDYDKTVKLGEDNCNEIIELGENDCNKIFELGCYETTDLRENDLNNNTKVNDIQENQMAVSNTCKVLVDNCKSQKNKSDEIYDVIEIDENVSLFLPNNIDDRKEDDKHIIPPTSIAGFGSHDDNIIHSNDSRMVHNDLVDSVTTSSKLKNYILDEEERIDVNSIVTITNVNQGDGEGCINGKNIAIIDKMDPVSSMSNFTVEYISKENNINNGIMLDGLICKTSVSDSSETIYMLREKIASDSESSIHQKLNSNLNEKMGDTKTSSVSSSKQGIVDYTPVEIDEGVLRDESIELEEKASHECISKEQIVLTSCGKQSNKSPEKRPESIENSLAASPHLVPMDDSSASITRRSVSSSLSAPSDANNGADFTYHNSNEDENRLQLTDPLLQGLGIEETSAVKIQSAYRGYKVRKVYRLIKDKQTSCEHSDDSDYDYDPVNLNEFNFQDSIVEWKLPRTPPLSSRSTPLPDIRNSMIGEKQVKEAWCPLEDPPNYYANEGDTCLTNNHPQSNSFQNNSTLGVLHTPNRWPLAQAPPNTSSTQEVVYSPNRCDSKSPSEVESTCSKSSKKTESISNEWGFQNEATAELMLKRAKKLGKSKRRKPVNSHERYQLFKKVVDVSPSVVSASRTNVRERKTYSQAHISPLPPDQRPCADDHQEMTYTWVCNQPVFHTDRAEELLSRNAGYFTEIPSPKSGKKPLMRRESEPLILPHLHPSVLAGRPLSLLQSEVHNPKPSSSKSTSAIAGEPHKHLVDGEKNSRSAPNPDRRTNPNLMTMNGSVEKWKRCAYR